MEKTILILTPTKTDIFYEDFIKTNFQELRDNYNEVSH